MTAPCRIEELMIHTIAGLMAEGLEDKPDGRARHIGCGVLSPIPGSAALLTRHLASQRMAGEGGRQVKVSIIGHGDEPFRTDGGVDIFDCAGQGRLDWFFLSGGQIDGGANVNLLGVGDYPGTTARWSGSFGSAYLYFMVPRVILFTLDHSRRTLVETVDFISAPGTSPANVHRPGGPYALITPRCLFLFDRDKGRFHLASIHPGETAQSIREHTGFDYDAPDTVPETEAPDAETLALLRGPVAADIAGAYPKFAQDVLGAA